MPAIEFVNVSKSFSRGGGQKLLRNYLKHLFNPAEKSEPFYALRHVSFEVQQGESLAIMGPNGAGKSTVLSIMAGLAQPSEGTAFVDGRVAALLELGSGFHPDLTGVENVRLNASLLGLSRKETDRLFETILEFSGIGDFINEPLRTYSAGMVVRLAFSVAVNVDPEILLVDEVLAVGDQTFQAKCLDKVHELRGRGKTMVCVSHAISILQQFCDRAIWLDHGELVMSGSVSDVAEAYTGRRATAQ